MGSREANLLTVYLLQETAERAEVVHGKVHRGSRKRACGPRGRRQ